MSHGASSRSVPPAYRHHQDPDILQMLGGSAEWTGKAVAATVDSGHHHVLHCASRGGSWNTSDVPMRAEAGIQRRTMKPPRQLRDPYRTKVVGCPTPLEEQEKECCIRKPPYKKAGKSRKPPNVLPHTSTVRKGPFIPQSQPQ